MGKFDARPVISSSRRAPCGRGRRRPRVRRRLRRRCFGADGSGGRRQGDAGVADGGSDGIAQRGDGSASGRAQRPRLVRDRRRRGDRRDEGRVDARAHRLRARRGRDRRRSSPTSTSRSTSATTASWRALGPTGDADLFDDQGVTGMHAIERILYADSIPAEVVAFERACPATRPPRSRDRGRGDGVQERLARAARDRHPDAPRPVDAGATLDVGARVPGAIGLMNEQQEKVNNAATGEEESRYSQRTMADLRANLDGTARSTRCSSGGSCRSPPRARRPGREVDARSPAGLSDLRDAVRDDHRRRDPAAARDVERGESVAGRPGDAVRHAVPGGDDAVDPTSSGSIVDQMNAGGDAARHPGLRAMTVPRGAAAGLAIALVVGASACGSSAPGADERQTFIAWATDFVGFRTWRRSRWTARSPRAPPTSAASARSTSTRAARRSGGLSGRHHHRQGDRGGRKAVRAGQARR